MARTARIATPARTGEWAHAVESLRRYVKANPSYRLGQAAVNAIANFWYPWSPTNAELVSLIEMRLDGKVPHLGYTLVISGSGHNDFTSGTIIGETWTELGEITVATIETALGPATVHLSEYTGPTAYGGQIDLVQPGLEAEFRTVLVAELTRWIDESMSTRIWAAQWALDQEFSWWVTPDSRFEWLCRIEAGELLPAHPCFMQALASTRSTFGRQVGRISAVVMTYQATTGTWPTDPAWRRKRPEPVV